MEELANTMRSPDFGKLSYEQRLDCMAEYLCLKALKENPKLQEEKQERLHRNLKNTGAARRSLSRLLTKFTGEQCLNELNSEYYSDSIYGKYLMYDSRGFISGYTEAQLTGIYLKSKTKKNVNIEYDKALEKGDTSEFHKQWNEAKAQRQAEIEAGEAPLSYQLGNAYTEANKARSTIRSAVISGKTMDMTKKKACIAKIMVNEVMTNMKYREESIGFGIGALTDYLPEAAMDPRPKFYNNQIEMMIHDKVFINMVSQLNEDQLVEFVVNPSDLTRKYVTSPDKAKSLNSVKEEIENAKASVSKKKTKDKTKDKSKDKTKSKTTDKTTSKTTGNKKGNEKTFKKK